MSCGPSKSMLLIAGILLISGRGVMAYLPLECGSNSSENDFRESSLIVIGKVTGINRHRTPARARPDIKRSFYIATITVGRTLKGDVKPGQDILFFMGFSTQKEDDNLHSRSLAVANSHSGWGLEVDTAYLICLRPSKYLEDKAGAEVYYNGAWQLAGLENRDVWEPRSCHHSVHRVARGRDPARVGLHLEHPPIQPEKTVTLDEFIAQQATGSEQQRESRTDPRVQDDKK